MNIVLTSNAKFKPYTFDEMLKPLAMATQEYNAIEEGIAELGSKADLMRMYASEEPDSDWAKRYNEYAKELDKQASSLAKYGLSPASRKGLLDLKRAYSSSVSPIEEAAKARKEAYKYRDTVRAKDNTAMFKNNTLSLSDFMNGKEGDNTYISGKDIMARVASKAQIEGTNMFNTLLEQGYSSDEAIQKVSEWSRNVNNPIIAEELKAVGFENYSPEDQAKLMNSIGTGMYNAASEIAKGEYLTKKERKSLRLQELNLAESKKQHSRTLQMNGYKEDGKENIIPDESSPYWALKGVEWKDGKPVYKKSSDYVTHPANGGVLRINKETGESQFIPGGSNNSMSVNTSNSGVNKVIGSEWGNAFGKGKEIKGVEYTIGTTKDELPTKATIVNSLQEAYNNGTAIILEDRGGFKIGYPKKDIPDNLSNDFGDIIKKDNSGNIDIDINKSLKIVNSTDTISYKDKNYDLNNYTLVSVSTSDGSTVYIGIPKNSGTSNLGTTTTPSTPTYGGGWGAP